MRAHRFPEKTDRAYVDVVVETDRRTDVEAKLPSTVSQPTDEILQFPGVAAHSTPPIQWFLCPNA